MIALLSILILASVPVTQEVPVDTSISGDWLLKAIPALATAFIGIIGAFLSAPVLKRKWQAEAIHKATVTVQGPIPKVHTKEEVELVTKPELHEALVRLEKDIEEIKEALEGERTIARESLGKVHARLDKVMENQALSRGELTQISANLSRVMDLLTKPPRR